MFGAARPHCAYLFANRRGNRMKALIHDGFGIWLCARRLHRGKFHWGDAWRGDQLRLTEEQLAALAAPGQRRCNLGAVTTPGSSWLYAQHRIARRARAWHSVRPDLNAFSPEQLRGLATKLFDHLESKDRAIRHRDAVIGKQAHELALLKRHKFARRSEQLKGVQGQLLEELIDADPAAMEAELA